MGLQTGPRTGEPCDSPFNRPKELGRFADIKKTALLKTVAAVRLGYPGCKPRITDHSVTRKR